jgi:hypothetical protein
LFCHRLLANISDVRAEGVQSVLQPPTRLQRAPDYAGNRLERIQSDPECLYDRGMMGEAPDRRIIVRLFERLSVERRRVRGWMDGRIGALRVRALQPFVVRCLLIRQGRPQEP